MVKRGIIVSSLTNKLNEIKDIPDFVMIRAGFTDYNMSKTKKVDSCFFENYNWAKENNIKIGTFYQSTATSINEVREELDFFINIIKSLVFEYPVAFKIEDDHNTIIYYPQNQKTIDKETLYSIVNYINSEIDNQGYIPLIITFKQWKENIFNDLKLNIVSEVNLDNYDVIFIDIHNLSTNNINIVVNKNCFFNKVLNYIKSGLKILSFKVRKK